MEKQFWLDKWKEGQTRFHQERYNPFLVKYWPKFAKQKGKVFVPLCGKSQDMQYFLEKGYEVIGVELSELAVREFFHLNRINYAIQETQRFNIFKGANITVYCGDIFDMGENDLVGIDYVYDRASLVALPFELRTKYLKFMFEKFSEIKYCLQTVEFDHHEIGPPFSIDFKMVKNYFSDKYEVIHKDKIKHIDENVMVHKGKVTYTQNNIFLMTGKGMK
jgi:thiopurine S-methyltransferase